jgi:DNA gyrase/topoisomerase IV subunit A
MKSATVVGDVSGKYLPLGDSSVCDAPVRVVQEFSLRYPLVDWRGTKRLSAARHTARIRRNSSAALVPLSQR